MKMWPMRKASGYHHWQMKINSVWVYNRLSRWLPRILRRLHSTKETNS